MTVTVGEYPDTLEELVNILELGEVKGVAYYINSLMVLNDPEWEPCGYALICSKLGPEGFCKTVAWTEGDVSELIEWWDQFKSSVFKFEPREGEVNGTAAISANG